MWEACNPEKPSVRSVDASRWTGSTGRELSSCSDSTRARATCAASTTLLLSSSRVAARAIRRGRNATRFTGAEEVRPIARRPRLPEELALEAAAFAAAFSAAA